MTSQARGDHGNHARQTWRVAWPLAQARSFWGQDRYQAPRSLGDDSADNALHSRDRRQHRARALPLCQQVAEFVVRLVVQREMHVLFSIKPRMLIKQLR